MDDDDDDVVTFPTEREALLTAMITARANGGLVYVCRGARIGCKGSIDETCGNCYVIDDQDRRTVDEHLASLDRMDG
jgi:hypothetical protein